MGGIRDAQKATEFRRSEELTGLLEEGVLCPGLDVLYQTMDDLVIAAQKQRTLLCENFLRGMNEFKLKDLINAEAFAAPNWNGDWPPCGRTWTRSLPKGMPSPCFPAAPKGAAALTRDLADKGYSVSMSRDVRPTKGIVQVLPGHLTAGCTFPFAHAAVLSSRRHGLDEEAAAETKSAKRTRTPCPAFPISSPATMWCTRATASACMRASSGWKCRVPSRITSRCSIPARTCCMCR